MAVMDYADLAAGTVPTYLFIAPKVNVMTCMDGVTPVRFAKYYDRFSLLKSIEAGLDLPCLSHACDASVGVMTDLFAGQRKWDNNEDHQFETGCMKISCVPVLFLACRTRVMVCRLVFCLRRCFARAPYFT